MRWVPIAYKMMCYENVLWCRLVHGFAALFYWYPDTYYQDQTKDQSKSNLGFDANEIFPSVLLFLWYYKVWCFHTFIAHTELHFYYSWRIFRFFLQRDKREDRFCREADYHVGIQGICFCWREPLSAACHLELSHNYWICRGQQSTERRRGMKNCSRTKMWSGQDCEKKREKIQHMKKIKNRHSSLWCLADFSYIKSTWDYSCDVCERTNKGSGLSVRLCRLIHVQVHATKNL